MRGGKAENLEKRGWPKKMEEKSNTPNAKPAYEPPPVQRHYLFIAARVLSKKVGSITCCATIQSTKDWLYCGDANIGL